MIKRYFIYYLLLSTFSAAPLMLDAHGDVAKPDRGFDVQKIDELSQESRFNYVDRGKTELEQFNSFLQAIGKFLVRFINPKVVVFILSNFHYLIIGIAVLIFIIYFARNKFSGFSQRNKVINETDLMISEGRIEDIDFSTLIQNALNEEKYNDAIRYQYLHLLQLMNEKGKISYEVYKTNYDYQYEIKDTEQRKLYMAVYYLFDLVWYGGFKLQKEHFNRHDANYKQLIQGIE